MEPCQPVLLFLTIDEGLFKWFKIISVIINGFCLHSAQHKNVQEAYSYQFQLNWIHSFGKVWVAIVMNRCSSLKTMWTQGENVTHCSFGRTIRCNEFEHWHDPISWDLPKHSFMPWLESDLLWRTPITVKTFQAKLKVHITSIMHHVLQPSLSEIPRSL